LKKDDGGKSLDGVHIVTSEGDDWLMVEAAYGHAMIQICYPDTEWRGVDGDFWIPYLSVKKYVRSKGETELDLQENHSYPDTSKVMEDNQIEGPPEDVHLWDRTDVTASIFELATKASKLLCGPTAAMKMSQTGLNRAICVTPYKPKAEKDEAEICIILMPLRIEESMEER